MTISHGVKGKIMKKVMLVLSLFATMCLAFALAGCGKPSNPTPNEGASKAPEPAPAKTAEKPAPTQAPEPVKGGAEIHRSLFAGGEPSEFTQVVVMVQDGKILAAHVDEFEFMKADTPNLVPVPGTTGKFGKNVKEGMVLMDKRSNADTYFEMMKKGANAKVGWVASMDAIQKFATGKTIDELQKAVDDMTASKKADAVSGATLEGTSHYLLDIVNCAKKSEFPTQYLPKLAKTDGITVGYKLGNPHSDMAFDTAVVFVQDGKIVGASVDGYQFIDKSSGAKGVPCSDKKFGENYADGKILISKSMDSDTYSAMMAKKAGATNKWVNNMMAIEAAAVGKSAPDMSKVDSVSSCTLESTPGYAKFISETAAEAK